jgi:hypothetical protein
MLTLINGEKLIVREECGVVVERVIAYRARLLVAVAKRQPNFGDLQRIVGLVSMDASGQSATQPAPRRQQQSDDTEER